MQAAIDFFVRGRWAMWPLLFCAIIGVAYIIERLITFARLRVDPQDLVEELIDIFKKDGASTAVEFCRQNPSPAARIFGPTIEKYKELAKKTKEKEVLEEVITRYATRELAFLDRGMLILAALTNITPMIGFLGTVSGMINAFDAIALAGTVEATLVASGISEALITTAAGLSLAIPFSMAHAFFTQKINAYTNSMEEASASLMDFLLEA
ncbi:MAG: MotA/TolQ/ExbB proton channel family protein [candidate division WOR-3 bacterium]